MRFIARSRAYQHWAQQEKVEVLNAEGDKKLIQRALMAQFRTAAGITPFERAEAEKLLVFTGRTVEEDEMTLTPIDERLGVFDSEVAQLDHGWTNDERIIVERSLMASNDVGVEFIMVETPKRPAPWPNYDVASAGSISKTVLELGLDPAEVLSYEQENKARVSVVRDLEEMLGEPVSEEITVVA